MNLFPRPQVMSSLLLALSIDYSMFLLTRLVDELEAEKDMREAVETALATSGHTVVGSGTALMLCFVALCFFPVRGATEKAGRARSGA